MPACCSTFERSADQQFTEKHAVAELKRYRTKGPGPTTRLLQDGIARAGVLAGTLLDIGSALAAAMPPVCASISIRMIAGTTGRLGKCP